MGSSGGPRCAELANPPSHPKRTGTRVRNAKHRACSAECERAVVSMHCCRLAGVVWLRSSQSFYSEGPGGSAASGTPPRESQNEVIAVQMAEVQDDTQARDEFVPIRLWCSWSPPRQVS